MSVYEDLRVKLYDAMETIFPSNPIVFAYTNGPEPVSPYIVLDIQSIKQEGEEYTSHFANAQGEQQIITQNTVRVRIDFESNGNDFTAAEMSEEFYRKLDYISYHELFMQQGLSYFRKSSIRKIPKKRETDWYMCYQMDVYFGYQVEARQNVNTVESVEIEGNYGDFQSTIQIP